VRSSCKGLVDYIAATYASAAEIGVGHFPDVSLALLEKGIHVFATDIKVFQYDELEVFEDDVTDPDLALYDGVEILFSLRPPPELIPYMRCLSKAIFADLIVKPLASEYPGGKLTGSGNAAFFQWSNL